VSPARRGAEATEQTFSYLRSTTGSRAQTKVLLSTHSLHAHYPYSSPTSPTPTMDLNTFVLPPPPPPVQQPPQQEQPPATAEDMMAFINDLQARQKHLEDQLQLANQRLQQQSNWVPPPPPGPPPQPPTPPRGPPPPPPPRSPLRPPPVTKRPKFAVPPKFTGKMANALEEFWAVFEADFGDPDRRSTKIMKLRTMVQGSRTMDEHVQDFKKVARSSGYLGVALVEEFKRSIHKAIREKLCNAETPPVTITEWYTRATASDRQWRRTKAEEQLYAPHGASPKKPATTTTAPAAPQQNRYNSWRPQGGNPAPAPQAPPAPPAPRDPNAMDVDRNRRGPLICYKCKRPGHMARDCKSRMDVCNMTYDDIFAYCQEKMNEQKNREDFPTGGQ
ncbi:hypothetical protein DXG01_009212, partial [Tephrocybe rancida]